MKRVNIDGTEVPSKEEFDKKVNVDGSLMMSADTDQLKFSDFSDGKSAANILRVFHDSEKSGLTIGNNGTCIVFGCGNSLGVLNIHWSNHQARIIGGVDNSNINWSEDIAWKSDIAKLEQEIADLKKQIGGVLSNSLSHLCQGFSHLLFNGKVAF